LHLASARSVLLDHGRVDGGSAAKPTIVHLAMRGTPGPGSASAARYRARPIRLCSFTHCAPRAYGSYDKGKRSSPSCRFRPSFSLRRDGHRPLLSHICGRHSHHAATPWPSSSPIPQCSPFAWLSLVSHRRLAPLPSSGLDARDTSGCRASRTQRGCSSVALG